MPILKDPETAALAELNFAAAWVMQMRNKAKAEKATKEHVNNLLTIATHLREVADRIRSGEHDFRHEVSPFKAQFCDPLQINSRPDEINNNHKTN